MTREEWEDVLFAAVPDEVVQDQLNDYVLSLEWEVAKLRELVRAAWKCIHTGLSCSDCRIVAGGCTLQSAMRDLGIKVDG